ncbi:hypothetical protein L249_3169 [Ophiocordyceps polyrhachis-furcata BCC 54312]|uniref:Cytochrome P450 n=1 Tax=Ophiocordyceps polyrhachis-furcata BCC 54312 TaxID=1330021 RepID=A0A367LN40_9HYPO|nr:hypothetical protein L249_3169 [Ophiocordyceps polyrhachis-furcata BCC 54312]
MFSLQLAYAILVIGTAIFGLFLWSLLQSPLRKVPNAHWTCGISSLWILWARYHNRELALLAEKHQRLGPIVRVGPADLSVSCYDDGIRTIYNGGFEKPAYYDFFLYYAQKNAFCSLSRADHSLRRRRIAPVYTKSALFASESLSTLTHSILYERLVLIIRRDAVSDKATDILSLSYALSLDLLTCFQFGLASGSNFLQAPPASLQTWMEHYEKRYCKLAAFWPQELPRLTLFLQSLGIDMVPESQRLSTKFLEDWLLGLCDRAEAIRLAKDRGVEVHPADVPVVYEILKDKVDTEMPGEKKMEIASELFDEMCLVLAYTIYYISRDSSAQRQLRAELETLDPNMRIPSDGLASGNRLPSPSSLDNLPYLTAILNESLRLRPTSTPLPRITPRDRAVSLAGTDGIPPGTRVNTFQWFIHRDPRNYSDVDEWRPERWTEPASKNGKSPMLWAFGGGSRMCVGASLSYYLSDIAIVMRYILAIIYTNFTSEVVAKRMGTHEPGSKEDEILVQFRKIMP